MKLLGYRKDWQFCLGSVPATISTISNLKNKVMSPHFPNLQPMDKIISKSSLEISDIDILIIFSDVRIYVLLMDSFENIFLWYCNPTKISLMTESSNLLSNASSYFQHRHLEDSCCWTPHIRSWNYTLAHPQIHSIVLALLPPKGYTTSNNTYIYHI